MAERRVVISDLPTEEGRARFEPRVEYAQVCTLIRHFSNLRLGQAAIFLAFMLGQLAFLVPREAVLEQVGVNASMAFASFLTILFWLLEERAAKQNDHLLGRARSLERILHFRTFRERPQHRFLRTGMAYRLLYAGTLVWWIAALSSMSRVG